MRKSKFFSHSFVPLHNKTNPWEVLYLPSLVSTVPLPTLNSDLGLPTNDAGPSANRCPDVRYLTNILGKILAPTKTSARVRADQTQHVRYPETEARLLS